MRSVFKPEPRADPQKKTGVTAYFCYRSRHQDLMRKIMYLQRFTLDRMHARGMFALLAMLPLACLPRATQAESNWIHGWVKRVVHGTDLHDIDKRECIRSLSRDDIAAHDFVVVGYGGFRGRRYITVVVPNGAELVPGESVWVDRTCLSLLRTDTPSR